MNAGIIPSSWSGPILSVLRIMTGLLFLAHGTTKLIRFPLTEQVITLNHRTRQIRVRLRGDAVVGMDNFGADLTFFPPFVAA